MPWCQLACKSANYRDRPQLAGHWQGAGRALARHSVAADVTSAQRASSRVRTVIGKRNRDQEGTDFMNVALWMAAGMLAAAALASGALKLAMPKAKLAAQRGGEWTNGFSAGQIKVIGVLEVLAAFGFVLPRLLDVAPVMVPVTALCWMALMAGAAITHGRLRQGKLVMAVAVYFAVAAFVAVGRF